MKQIKRKKRVTDVEVKKSIIIHRRPISNLPGQDQIESNKKIGSSFTAPVLTFEEEEKFMPNIINAKPDSQGYRRLVEEYFANIGVPVPVTGLTLEIGFAYPDEEMALKGEQADETERHNFGEPIVVSDYVLYRYCLVYSRVANIGVDYNKSPKIRFYMQSPDHDKRNRESKRKLRTRAYQLFVELESDTTMIKNIVSVLRADPEIDVNYVEPGTEATEVETFLISNPKKFISIANDTDLKTRAFIEDAIESRILERPVNSTIVMYGTDLLGNSMQEAIAYLKSEDNAAIYNQVKAQVEAFKQPAAAITESPVERLARIQASPMTEKLAKENKEKSDALKAKDEEIERLRAQLAEQDAEEKEVTDSQLSPAEDEEISLETEIEGGDEKKKEKAPVPKIPGFND